MNCQWKHSFFDKLGSISFRIDKLSSELTQKFKVDHCTRNWTVIENTASSTNWAQIKFRIDNLGLELTQKIQSWPLY